MAGQGINSRSTRQAVEIPSPHGGSGNRFLVWIGTRLAVALIVNKEERVILAVVEMRDIDRPAEAAAKSVEHFVLFFGRAVSGGVQRGVLEIPQRAAVQLVGATAGDDGHITHLAKLRIVVYRSHLELAQHFS